MGKEIRKLSELNNVIGYWNSPDEENSIQGTLQYFDDTIHIKTVEDFSNNNFGWQESSYDVLNGFIETGENVTFIGNMLPTVSMSIPGLQQFVFTPTYVFVGKQYKSENIKLIKISAIFNGLDKWIGQTSFFRSNNEEYSEVSITYKKPIYERIRCGNKTIYFETDTSFQLEYYTSGSIRQRTWLSIEFDEALTWNDAFSVLHDYADFLTLCFGTRCKPEQITAKDEDNTGIQIFENVLSDPVQKLKAQFIIPYSDIKNRYSTVLNIWFEKKEEISPIIFYFVEAHTSETRIKVVPSFLRMVQALESFSRKLRQCTLLSAEENAARIERIICQVEECKDREWLKEILERPVINEPSCQQRIKKLFAEMPLELELNGSRLKSLSYKIVTTRNYYTHFDDSLGDKIMDTREIYYATIFMKYILRMLFVNELGIDVAKVIEKIKSDSEFIYTVKELKLNK